jgi:hypothetical protein
VTRGNVWATHMRRHPHAATPGGGVYPGAKRARLAAAWLLLLAAAGASQAQTAAAQADQSAGLTPQERSLYLLKAAVNGGTVSRPRQLCNPSLPSQRARLVCLIPAQLMHPILSRLSSFG